MNSVSTSCACLTEKNLNDQSILQHKRAHRLFFKLQLREVCVCKFNKEDTQYYESLNEPLTMDLNTKLAQVVTRRVDADLNCVKNI